MNNTVRTDTRSIPDTYKDGKNPNKTNQWKKQRCMDGV